MKYSFRKLGKIGLSASRTRASKGTAVSEKSSSPSKLSALRAGGWRKKLLSFGKQRKSLGSVAPAPELVPKATVEAGWERKSGPLETVKRGAMSAPNPEEHEGVEEMETDMSPEPDGERTGECPQAIHHRGLCLSVLL